MAISLIRNKTKHNLTVSLNGDVYVLGGEEEKLFPAEVVQAFAERYGDSVSGAAQESVGKVSAPPPPKDVYIANFTGNPDAPETIRVKFANRATHSVEYVEKPNPLRVAKTYETKMNGGMQEMQHPAGLPIAKNLLARRFKIEPYEVKKFPAHIAFWMLQRDANSPVQLQGRIRRSRELPEFRPTLEWALDDIRAFLCLQDKKAELGPSEGELRQKAKQKRLKDAAGEPISEEQAINDAKLLAWKRTHFRLADPETYVPTKAEFEAFRAKQLNNAAETAAKAQAVIAKVNQQNAGA